MSKLKVAVVFGGASYEHEVSIVTAMSIIDHLNRQKYDVYPIGITKNGCSYHVKETKVKDIGDVFNADFDCVPSILSPDVSHHGAVEFNPDGTYKIVKLDCVFFALHGKNGEDGTIQGLCEMASLPYVGCSVASSANCMDKIISHTILDHNGVKGVEWDSIEPEDLTNLDAKSEKLIDKLGLPIFVKPACSGSSVGISKARSKFELKEAVKLAFKFDKRVICERNVTGKEIECAVLGNQNPKASILGRITPCNEFYDYDAKYKSDSKLEIPARIDEKTALKIRNIAILAYKIMGCEGLSRVDFLVDQKGEIYLNEINTLPGFTSISMYPKLWEKTGLCYENLLQELISLAIARHNDKK